MAASQLIVAFWQLPARPYKPQEKPPPERFSLAERVLSLKPLQGWLESPARVQPEARGGTEGPEVAEDRGRVAQSFGAECLPRGARVHMAAAQTLDEASLASARRVHALDEELPGEVGDNQPRLRRARAKGGPGKGTTRTTTFFPGG